MKPIDTVRNANNQNTEPGSSEYVSPFITSAKRISDLKKVQILEDVVMNGNIEDLKQVLHAYQYFEMTARALALAGRYRGIDFVKELVDNGASFEYGENPSIKGKYGTIYKTDAGSYNTEYYLMLIPSKGNLKPKTYRYSYSPFCGIQNIKGITKFEKEALPLQERIRVIDYLSKQNVSMPLDEMLYWSLISGEIDIADTLIKDGAGLQSYQCNYYSSSWGSDKKETYLDMLTTGSRSLYWNNYVEFMSCLKSSALLPVLERMNKLASAIGGKIILTDTLFWSLKWNEKAFEFAIDHMDLSKVNQKKVLKYDVSHNKIGMLSIVCSKGWLDQPQKREEIIEYARKGKYNTALVWLLDFKNRTVDIAAENKKKEKKLMRELNESPDSVSYLKKFWDYTKNGEGTIEITYYRGCQTEIVIPAHIGKYKVTGIGNYAFSPYSKMRKNIAEKAKIQSVQLPEGIEYIGTAAFEACRALKDIILPNSLKEIGFYSFEYCTSLERIVLPDGLEKIGGEAFSGCTALIQIVVPSSVNKIENGAFVNCAVLRDFYISRSINDLIDKNTYYYDHPYIFNQPLCDLNVHAPMNAPEKDYIRIFGNRKVIFVKQ